MIRLGAAALAALLLVPTPRAQSPGALRIDPCGGSIGKPVQYRLHGGRPGYPFLFLTSTMRARFPMSLLDARDTRELGVGFELIGITIVGALNLQGELQFSWPIPNDKGLINAALLHQALSYPGQPLFFEDISNVAVVAFDQGGAWQRKPTLTMAQPRSFHTVSPLGDGLHLLAGGGTGALLALTSNDTSEIYDEATRQFSTGPQLTSVRGVHTATRLQDGNFLLTGGVDAINDPQNSTDIYDRAKNVFVAGPTMQGKRMGHEAVLLDDGRVLVVGGLSDLNNQLAALGSALDCTEIYDPKTNSFTNGPKLAEPKAGATLVRLNDGRILIVGGTSWTTILAIRVPNISKRCEIFDPKTNQLSSTGSLGTERALGAATLLPDGRVLVAGGVSGSIAQLGAPTASAEIFDPNTGKWSAVAPMQVARGFAPGLWLSDGRFAVFGGAGGNLLSPAPVPAVEAFDPKTNSWATLPSLVSPRTAATATRMSACGVVLIGGGSGSSGAAVSTQELLLGY